MPTVTSPGRGISSPAGGPRRARTPKQMKRKERQARRGELRAGAPHQAVLPSQASPSSELSQVLSGLARLMGL